MATPNRRVSLLVERPPPKKHEEYYLEAGDVVLLVEDTLFCLQLERLHARSAVLRLIMPPVYDGQKRLQGFNDASPFHLPGVTMLDFVKLLRVLHPLPTTPDPPLSTVDDWLAMLKLARQYEVEDIAPIAAKHLHTLPMDAIRKVMIWDMYRLDPALLVSAYVALCTQAKPLTLSMTMSLGLKTFTKVAAVREEYQRRVLEGCRSCRKASSTSNRKMAEELVKKAFYSTSTAM